MLPRCLVSGLVCSSGCAAGLVSQRGEMSVLLWRIWFPSVMEEWLSCTKVNLMFGGVVGRSWLGVEGRGSIFTSSRLPNSH